MYGLSNGVIEDDLDLSSEVTLATRNQEFSFGGKGL